MVKNLTFAMLRTLMTSSDELVLYDALLGLVAIDHSAVQKHWV